MDAQLSDDFRPQADDCTCWAATSTYVSPMRCYQCVAALVVREAEDGTLGEAFTRYVRDAIDAAHEIGGESLPDVVLEELAGITAERAPSLLRSLISRRSAYAGQLRPSTQRRGGRPDGPERRWGVLRLVRDDDEQ